MLPRPAESQPLGAAPLAGVRMLLPEYASAAPGLAAAGAAASASLAPLQQMAGAPQRLTLVRYLLPGGPQLPTATAAGATIATAAVAQPLGVSAARAAAAAAAGSQPAVFILQAGGRRPGDAPPQHPRIKRACTACQHAKTRCQDVRPCHRCVATGKASKCRDAPPARDAAAPAAAAAASSASSPPQPQQQLDGALSEAATPPPAQSPAPRRSPEPPNPASAAAAAAAAASPDTARMSPRTLLPSPVDPIGSAPLAPAPRGSGASFPSLAFAGASHSLAAAVAALPAGACAEGPAAGSSPAAKRQRLLSRGEEDAMPPLLQLPPTPAPSLVPQPLSLSHFLAPLDPRASPPALHADTLLEGGAFAVAAATPSAADAVVAAEAAAAAAAAAAPAARPDVFSFELKCGAAAVIGDESRMALQCLQVASQALEQWRRALASDAAAVASSQNTWEWLHGSFREAAAAHRLPRQLGLDSPQAVGVKRKRAALVAAAAEGAVSESGEICKERAMLAQLPVGALSIDLLPAPFQASGAREKVWANESLASVLGFAPRELARLLDSYAGALSLYPLESLGRTALRLADAFATRKASFAQGSRWRSRDSTLLEMSESVLVRYARCGLPRSITLMVQPVVMPAWVERPLASRVQPPRQQQQQPPQPQQPQQQQQQQQQPAPLAVGEPCAVAAPLTVSHMLQLSGTPLARGGAASPPPLGGEILRFTSTTLSPVHVPCSPLAPAPRLSVQVHSPQAPFIYARPLDSARAAAHAAAAAGSEQPLSL
jgi:hypothetical protein